MNRTCYRLMCWNCELVVFQWFGTIYFTDKLTAARCHKCEQPPELYRFNWKRKKWDDVGPITGQP